jgi:MYXO-CTERM domain-containing protein
VLGFPTVRSRVFVAAGALGVSLGSTAWAADGGVPDGGLPPAPVDVIAEYCSDVDFECTSAPLTYEKTVSLPIAFDFDTGWIPPGSDIQVRFFLKIPASTTVKLNGWLETTWPDAMTLATPGGPGAELSFDYGLEVGAKAKIDVNVIGIPVKWEADIPYVPQVDFHLKGATEFQSWGFPPNGPTVSGKSDAIRVLEVNLLDLAGIPSQIAKGGIALDVQGELEATYETERIRIELAGADDSDITTEDGMVNRAFLGGAFVEYDVWPEGHVDYSGTLHLIPTFFVEVLGKDFDFGLFDFPVTFDIGTEDFVFDPVRVHVPLPDLEKVEPVLDFGSVSVGESKTLAVALSNIGEAKARATGFVETTTTKVFSLPAAETTIASMDSGKVSVAFKPTTAGKSETVLTLVTNDPDNRFQTVTLRGNGVDGPVPKNDDTKPSPQAEDDGGCGCQAPRNSPRAASLALFALAALVLRRRQGRASTRI